MTQQPLFYFGRIVTMTHDLTMLRFVRKKNSSLPVYKLKIALYHFLMWQAHRKSQRIIVPTQTVAKELAEYQPFTRRKIVVTLEAGDLPLTGAGEQPPQVRGKDFLLYVGTAFPHKNHFKAIEAFDILHVQRPRLNFVFAGKTEKHYEELKAWAASRPSHKNLIFTGFVPDAQLKWLFEHCRAYVFASLSEGFGLPPLEAMSYGAPVVSSRASAMPEVLGDAAHYFDPYNPKDIAAKIAEVLDDTRLRTKLIAAGREQIKKYSWERMAQETLIVYKEVLGEVADE